jgi:hypothetical protein
LPSGAAFFSAPILNSTLATLSSTCGGQQGTTGGIDTTQSGPEVFGQGQGNSVLIPLPYFNFTGCTLGQSGLGCIGTAPNLAAHDFQINGLANSVPTAHTAYLFELDGSSGGQTCTGSTGFNLTMANWALQSTGTVGFSMGAGGCANLFYWNNIIELFGATSVQANASQSTILLGNAILGFTATGLNLIVGNLGQMNTYSNYILAGIPTGGTINYVTMNAQSAGTSYWNSTGDYLVENLGGTFGMNGIFLPNSTGKDIINLNRTILTIGPAATATSQCFAMVSTGGSSVRTQGSTITCTGPNNRTLDTTAGNNFFDDGGNTFTNGSQANAIGGNVFGTLSSIGSVPVTGNFSITNAAFTSEVGSDEKHFTLTVTNAGGGGIVTIVYTFPAAFPFVAPGSCHALQIGGTQPSLIFNTTTGPSTTAVTFTSTVAGAGNDTIIMNIDCQ